jgi:hypothetical protein
MNKACHNKLGALHNKLKCSNIVWSWNDEDKENCNESKNLVADHMANGVAHLQQGILLVLVSDRSKVGSGFVLSSFL